MSEDNFDPEGRDERAEQIKQLARSHAELAIATLAEVADNPDAKEAARVKAADVLLQRGFGAPERRVEQKVDINVFDQRQAHLTALQKLAARHAPLQITDQADIEDAEYTEIKAQTQNVYEGW